MVILGVSLQTARLPLLRDCYTQTLGFELLQDAATHFCVAAGATKLTFTQAADSASGPYHFGFQLPYDKMREAQAWLQERVRLLPDPTTNQPLVQPALWQAQAPYFPNPEGNILEFIGHRTLPSKAKRAPFDTRQVLRICEMGMAVPEVPGVANQLKAKLGVGSWYIAHENFEAVGDVHGPLMLVEEKRP